MKGGLDDGACVLCGFLPERSEGLEGALSHKGVLMPQVFGHLGGVDLLDPLCYLVAAGGAEL